MGNKFDFDVAEQLCETLSTVADTMETENQKVQDSFTALHESFRDKAYEEFKSDFNAADRTMARIISDLREMHKTLNEYKIRLRDSV